MMTIVITAVIVLSCCVILLIATKNLSTDLAEVEKLSNAQLNVEALSPYYPKLAPDFPPIIPSFPPFDLDAAFQSSLDEAATHKEKLRQSVINGPIFKTATDYIASILERQLGIDVYLGKIDVDLWGIKPDAIYKWQFFLEEFSKMCQSKGIKTKISENGSFLILELQSLLQYRDSLFGTTQ